MRVLEQEQESDSSEYDGETNIRVGHQSKIALLQTQPNRRDRGETRTTIFRAPTMTIIDTSIVSAVGALKSAVEENKFTKG